MIIKFLVHFLSQHLNFFHHPKRYLSQLVLLGLNWNFCDNILHVPHCYMSWDATDLSFSRQTYFLPKGNGWVSRLENYKGEKTQFDLSARDSIIFLDQGMLIIVSAWPAKCHMPRWLYDQPSLWCVFSVIIPRLLSFVCGVHGADCFPCYQTGILIIVYVFCALSLSSCTSRYCG